MTFTPEFIDTIMDLRITPERANRSLSGAETNDINTQVAPFDFAQGATYRTLSGVEKDYY